MRRMIGCVKDNVFREVVPSEPVALCNLCNCSFSGTLRCLPTTYFGPTMENAQFMRVTTTLFVRYIDADAGLSEMGGGL